MKEDTVKQITEAVDGWAYLKELPKKWHGFQLRRLMHVHGDIYDICGYYNDEARKGATLYYHDETKEYKLRARTGLTEFCNCDFIMPDLESMEAVLKERLDTILYDMAFFHKEKIDSIVIDKKILEWDYLEKIPAVIEGFTRFITPDKPLKAINGSYIIFDYCDFANESNFAVYYNIFRDEFFGEAKIRNIPDVNYIFDSHELSELEEKLDQHLAERLREIRAKLEAAAEEEEE